MKRKYVIWLGLGVLLLNITSCSSIPKTIADSEKKEFNVLKKKLSDLFSKREYKDELVIAQKFLILSKRIYGESSLSTAYAYYRLGRVHKGLKLFENSNKYLLKSIYIYREIKYTVIKKDASYPQLYNYIYYVENLRLSGRYYVPKELIEDMKILNFYVDRKQINTQIEFLDVFAFVLNRNGYPSYSIEILEKLVKLSKKNFGNKSYYYLRFLNSLSFAYIKLKNYKKARKFSDEIVSIYSRSKIKKITRDYLVALNNLSFIDFSEGKYKESILNMKKTVELYETNIKLQDIGYIGYLRQLMILYYEIRDYNNSLICAKKILSIDKIKKFKSRYIGDAYLILGNYYRINRNFINAQELYIKAMNLFKMYLGEKYLDFIRTALYLQYVYFVLKNPQSRFVIDNSLTVLYKHFGKNKKVFLGVYALIENFFTLNKNPRMLKWAKDSLAKVQKW